MSADFVGQPVDRGPPFREEPENGPFHRLFFTEKRRPSPFVWREEGDEGPFSRTGVAIDALEGGVGRRRGRLGEGEEVGRPVRRGRGCSNRRHSDARGSRGTRGGPAVGESGIATGVQFLTGGGRTRRPRRSGGKRKIG